MRLLSVEMSGADRSEPAGHGGEAVAPVRRADAQRRRDGILSAAGALFERDPGASMTDVAAAAGVGRSTLHRHFRTRRELSRVLAAESAAAREHDREARRPPVPEHSTPRDDDVALRSAPPGLLSPGQLGRAEPLPLEALHVLDQVPPHLVADQLVAEAQRVAGVPVALYVIDVDGSGLLRLAGESEDLPARIEVPLGLNQEIAPESLPDLYAHLESQLPGCLPAPLWLRGRATGVLLAVGTPLQPLAEIARQGAAALELANRYTDVFEAVRRRRATSPAAEMQLNLLPCARVVRVAGAELAGGVLPSPDVGGDWFDWSDNREGTWLAMADASGHGPVAAGRAAVSLGAFRSARRRGLGVEGAALVVHQLVHDLGDDFCVSAVIALWQAPISTLHWVSCGHPPPLLIAADGSVEELPGEADPALGLAGRQRAFRLRQRRLRPSERVIIYSDGVVERRTVSGGRFGLAGIRAAVSGAGSTSAAGTARSIQHAAVRASPQPLEDDAAVVILAAG